MAEFALKRDLGDLSVQEFAAEDALMENDRKRINDHFDNASTDYAGQIKKFRPWLNRIRMRIATMYPTVNRSSVDGALQRIGRSLEMSEKWSERRQNAYENALNAEINPVKRDRRLFKAGSLSRADYAAKVNAVIERCRAFPKIEIAGGSLDGAAADEVMTFVQQRRPAVK